MAEKLIGQKYTTPDLVAKVLGYDAGLLQVHDRKPYPNSVEDIAALAADVRDANFRIETAAGRIAIMFDAVPSLLPGDVLLQGERDQARGAGRPGAGR